jgi:hypothetical protein
MFSLFKKSLCVKCGDENDRATWYPFLAKITKFETCPNELGQMSNMAIFPVEMEYQLRFG